MAKEDKFADEMLTDEQLEQVAGGSPGETADDSRFLNVLLNGTTKYHHCDRYGEFKVFTSPASCTDVEKSWNSLGIKIKIYRGSPNKNEYTLNGKQISRDEAWAYAENKVGRHLTKAEWNW